MALKLTCDPIRVRYVLFTIQQGSKEQRGRCMARVLLLLVGVTATLHDCKAVL